MNIKHAHILGIQRIIMLRLTCNNHTQFISEPFLTNLNSCIQKFHSLIDSCMYSHWCKIVHMDHVLHLINMHLQLHKDSSYWNAVWNYGYKDCIFTLITKEANGHYFRSPLPINCSSQNDDTPSNWPVDLISFWNESHTH